MIIGNPPYVEIKVAEKSYQIGNVDYNTGGNLHSVVASRVLLFLRKAGLLGLIVPVAISNTDRMKELRKQMVSHGSIWISNYSIRPGKLFSGAEQRLSIYILKNNKSNSGNLYSSKYYKWHTEFKFPYSILQDNKLIKLSEKLQQSLIEHSWFQIRNQKQTGEVKIQSFTSSISKEILDAIDRILAEHYGFTEEELDFIINYDIKYRMGSELNESE